VICVRRQRDLSLSKLRLANLTLLRPETLPVDSNSRPPLFRFFFLFYFTAQHKPFGLFQGEIAHVVVVAWLLAGCCSIISSSLFTFSFFFFFFFFFFFTSKMEDIKNTIAG
jgi:hypothetical protein